MGICHSLDRPGRNNVQFGSDQPKMAYTLACVDNLLNLQDKSASLSAIQCALTILK